MQIGKFVTRGTVILGLFGSLSLALAAETSDKKTPFVAPASPDAELAIKKFKVAPGLKVSLFAAEPLLANPVAFSFDEQGRCYVVETFRHTDGVLDIRNYMSWLDDDLACRSVEDRTAMIRKHMTNLTFVTAETDRVRLVIDRNGDGRADDSTVFADGFDNIPDGLAAGVLARRGKVWFTNIPELWLLQDTNGDGRADIKKSLQHGFGVHMGFLGHDLHGLRMGPDGKLYFSIGDRGSHLKTSDGRDLNYPDTGAVFRCNPDGSGMEVFAYGLRNPQELAFDAYGNLFTGDNNSDSGDRARWVYVVEGGDSGWRTPYQFMESPNPRGPWNWEKLWHPHFEGQAAYIVPPIDHIASGPSGLTYFPGTGFPARYANHFFLCDFRGSARSVVYSFSVKPKGASFELVQKEELITGLEPTDVDFGVDGGLYVADWVEGWNKTGKGRIYRLTDPAQENDPAIRQTRELFRSDWTKKSNKELASLLEHPDMRIRQNAQFELVEKSRNAAGLLSDTARKSKNQFARIHALWGLGQIGAASPQNVPPRIQKTVVALLSDADAEIRAQAERISGDLRLTQAVPLLIKNLANSSERVQFFAALSLGKLKAKEALNPLLTFIKTHENKDPYLRHAGVMGLAGIGDARALDSYASSDSAAVRTAVLLAWRRLHDPALARYLADANPEIATEAARAIYDEPFKSALPQLASLASGKDLSFAAWKRAISANHRLGDPVSAKRLAGVAANNSLPEAERVDALQCLGDWAEPSGRDRVLGRWDPVGKRDGAIASKELAAVIDSLLKDSHEQVAASAAAAAGKLGLAQAESGLAALVKNGSAGSMARVEALKALELLKSSELAGAVQAAQEASSENLRKEAARLQALIKPQGAASKLSLILERGSLGEKQAALGSLATVDDPEANRILLAWVNRLVDGKVQPDLQLDLLEAASKRNQADLADRLKLFESHRAKNDPLAAYREVLSGGNKENGKKIFYEKAETSCFRCHQVNGEGGEVGPVLTGIGSRQTREYILESILFPNNQIAPGFESVLVTTSDGGNYAGILKKETDKELEINSPEDGLVKVAKDKVKSRAKGLSAMPADMANVLSKRDLRDLIEFLSGLK